jgi:hypothetical protein
MSITTEASNSDRRIEAEAGEDAVEASKVADEQQLLFTQP